MDTTLPPPAPSPSQGHPACTATPPSLFEQPSWWLRAGFVRYEDDEDWVSTRAWVRVRADQPFDRYVRPVDGREPLDALFCRPSVRALLGHLAETFALFFPITAEQWELDLRRSPQPKTLLRLWETVLGVYRYYTADKKLPQGAATDYFWLLLDYCNDGAAYALRPRPRYALTPGRITRVVAELGRWFRRSGSS